jgi:hypothetical protein
LKAGDFGLEAWRGFDFLGDEFLKVVGLFFEAGNGFFNNRVKRVGPTHSHIYRRKLVRDGWIHLMSIPGTFVRNI